VITRCVYEYAHASAPNGIRMRSRKVRPLTLPAMIKETVPTRKARPHTKEMVRLTERNCGVPQSSFGVVSRA
jgi:hypothetical protein